MSEPEKKEYTVPIVCHQHGYVKVRAKSLEDADKSVLALNDKRLMKFFKRDVNFITRGKAREPDV